MHKLIITSDTPHSTPSKCPYAAVAGLSASGLGKTIQEIAGALDTLVFAKSSKYGDARRHPSLFNESEHFPEKQVLKEDELPPIERMIGRIHAIYRTEMARSVSGILDVNRLDKETQTLIAAFNQSINAYRTLVLSTMDKSSTNARMHFPDYNKIPKNAENECIKAAPSNILNSLKKKLKSEKTIPVMIDGKETTLDNKGNVGFFLFALGFSIRSLDDSNKVPFNVSSTLRNTTSAGRGIPEKWNKHLGSDVLMPIHAAALPKILAEIKSAEYDLQVLQLTDSKPARTLLKSAGLELAPCHLRSDVDLVRICSKLILSAHSEVSVTRKIDLNFRYLKPLATDENGFLHLNREELQALKKMLGSEKVKAVAPKHAVELCLDYIENHKIRITTSPTKGMVRGKTE